MMNDEECNFCDSIGWEHNCTRCKEWHEHGLVHVDDSSQRYWVCDKCWLSKCNPDEEDMEMFSDRILGQEKNQKEVINMKRAISYKKIQSLNDSELLDTIEEYKAKLKGNTKPKEVVILDRSIDRMQMVYDTTRREDPISWEGKKVE